MNVNLRLMNSRAVNNVRAAVVYSLLLMIAYGAIIESVHSHGKISKEQRVEVAFTNADGAQSSRSGHSQLTECSICQFQQQLDNGIVQAPLFALKLSVQNTTIEAPTIVCPSISTPTSPGRAPPLALG